MAAICATTRVMGTPYCSRPGVMCRPLLRLFHVYLTIPARRPDLLLCSHERLLRCPRVRMATRLGRGRAASKR